MPNPTNAQTLAPEFRVRINGADLPPQAQADVITAAVHEGVEVPGMFTLQLVNWDMAKLKVTWADDDLFAEVKIARAVIEQRRIGYINIPPLIKKSIISYLKFFSAIYLRINFTANRFSLALARTCDLSPISCREGQSNI